MLNKRLSYLQIAFNRTLPEVEGMIRLLPSSERILIEAGTSFVKNYGQSGIAAVKRWWSCKLGKPGYIVADLKCMDRGFREVELAARAGARAATCLGLAPISTIDLFIKKCKELGVDSMIDMLNVKFPFEILQKLTKLPDVVVLHRGVEEWEKGKEKAIPLWQIHRILGTYNVLISVAGGETSKKVREAIFNDAGIAVVWRAFCEAPEKTTDLARAFLKELK